MGFGILGGSCGKDGCGKGGFGKGGGSEIFIIIFLIIFIIPLFSDFGCKK